MFGEPFGPMPCRLVCVRVIYCLLASCSGNRGIATSKTRCTQVIVVIAGIVAVNAAVVVNVGIVVAIDIVYETCGIR